MRKKKKELSIEEQAHRDRLRDLYCGVFVLTVIVWFFRFCLGGLASLAAPHLNYYFATALAVIAEGASVFLPFFIFLKFRRDPIKPILKETPKADHVPVRCLLGFLSIAGLTVGAMGVTDWVLSQLDESGLHSNITVPDFGSNWMESVFYILLSTVVYSFVYEFAYRGIALRTAGSENRTAAVLVSGLAFALCDGHPHHIVVRLAIGFVLGWFYLRVRSVWPCMVLHAASQILICLWQILVQNTDRAVYTPYLVLIGLVFGIASAYFLFFPRRKPDADNTKTSVSLGLLFKSFGIYLMVALVAFNLLIFTFWRDSDPTDPLLQPTPEEGYREPIHFDRNEEFMDEYGTTDPVIED